MCIACLLHAATPTTNEEMVNAFIDFDFQIVCDGPLNCVIWLLNQSDEHTSGIRNGIFLCFKFHVVAHVELIQKQKTLD